MARRVGFGPAPRGQVPSMKTRIIVGFLLSGWLVGWTYGIYFVASRLIGEDGPEGIGQAMVIVWLVLAVIGWLFVVRVLLRIIQGRPLRTGKRAKHVGKQPFPLENGPGESGRGFDN
jgi:hypothetical protein